MSNNENKNKAIPLVERWNMDVEFYEKNKDITILTESPQCELCKYKIQLDAFHCEKYVIENKPEEVINPSKECKQFYPKGPLFIEAKSKKEKNIYSGLFGFIVGDALGVPLEFCTRKERVADPVREMRAYGTYHQYFGTWSDDTSLTLATLEAFVNGFSLDELSKQFIAYVKDAKFTPHGKVFDIGIATQNAITRMEKGVAPLLAGGISEQDNGNGSLMRILPLAFYLQDKNADEIIEMISNVSSLTHRTQRAILGCIIYVVFAINLLKGENKQNAYQKMIDFAYENCREKFESELSTYEMILNGKLSSTYGCDINSTGYIVDTLIAVMWVFLTTETYQESIFRAINLGGDTDTIAAITGGLSGIFYGYESIPNQWIQTLAQKEYLLDLMKEFNKRCSDY